MDSVVELISNGSIACGQLLLREKDSPVGRQMFDLRRNQFEQSFHGYVEDNSLLVRQPSVGLPFQTCKRSAAMTLFNQYLAACADTVDR